jgi:hypothetical protein
MEDDADRIMREEADLKREALREELAMRLFLKDVQDMRCLTNSQQLRFRELWDKGGEAEAWPYLAETAAQNARRDADLFVKIYYGDA